VPSSITESSNAGRLDTLVPEEWGEPGEPERRSLTVPPELAGSRVDQALARLLPEFSRSRLQAWIKDGLLTLDGHRCRPRDKVAGGERAELRVLLEDRVECRPQPIALSIVYEDEELLVIDKPSGLVMHPGAGNPDGTLQNGLLYHDARLAQLPRCGIVHRLDKETSGLLVVAKSLRAHSSLVAQLQGRSVKRQYLAVVSGVPVAGGTVDAPIGRHPTQRTRMAVTPGGKPAVTHYRVKERFQAHSLLEVRLETGRTHQIRVHLAHIRYPILGDPLYGGRLSLPPGASPALILCLRAFRRQALHAERLTLRHPLSGEELGWQAPPPPDMGELIEVLREEAK
jgi:23S rRNA pseudouridine1911/1915/1917 synthase